MSRGSKGEAIGGVALMVLALFGMMGLRSGILASVCAIVTGATLLFLGAAGSMHYAEILPIAGPERKVRSRVEGATSTEQLGGIMGIFLGVLALIGIAPSTLVPLSVILFGGTILLSTSLIRQLGTQPSIDPEIRKRIERTPWDKVFGKAGIKVIAGVTATFIGLLALFRFLNGGIVLSLMAFLVLGAMLFVSGSFTVQKKLAPDATR